VILDVGGGPGAHSIGAVTVWPHLKALVLDQEPVRAIAREFMEKYGAADRISIHAPTRAGRNSPLPMLLRSLADAAPVANHVRMPYFARATSHGDFFNWGPPFWSALEADQKTRAPVG
jgi:hypothetical protein